MATSNFVKYSGKKTNNTFIYLTFEKGKYNEVELAFLASLLQYNNVDNLSRHKRKLEELYDTKISYMYYPAETYDCIKINIKYINMTNLGVDLNNEIKKVIMTKMKSLRIDKKYFAIEKENVIYNLKAVYDERMTYAIMKGWEGFYSNEPHYMSNEKTLAKIEKISLNKLVKMWEDIRKNCNISVYNCGNKKPQTEMITLRKDKVIKPKRIIFNRNKSKVVENKKNNQSKLVMTYNIEHLKEEDKLKYQMFNLVFGGDSHSFLFQNVREKESLCYFTRSIINLNQGAMLVITALDKQNIKFATTTIEKQFENIKAANWETKLAETKAIMIENYKAIKLNESQFIDFTFKEKLEGNGMTIEKRIKEIEKIKINDLIELADTFILYGTYILN